MSPNRIQHLAHLQILSILIVLLSGCATPTTLKGTEPDTIDGNEVTMSHKARAEPAIPGVENLSACPLEANDLVETMLTLLNQTRSQARTCGNSNWDAAPPLIANKKLNLAAARHSADMATNNFFSHVGSNGKKADSRTNDADYQWFSVAENIAGGQTETIDVIEDWLKSDKHCENLMRPELTEMGVGCFKNDDTSLKIYWTLVLARPLLE